jgi:hypothetical protein
MRTYSLICYIIVYHISFHTHVVPAMTSNECVAAVTLHSRPGCSEPICGSLDLNWHSEAFYDVLSPSCKSIMAKYRSNVGDDQTDVQHNGCVSAEMARYATAPTVVQTGETPGFAICTIPKAGCSLWRSLLAVLTHHPKRVSWIGA